MFPAPTAYLELLDFLITSQWSSWKYPQFKYFMNVDHETKYSI